MWVFHGRIHLSRNRFHLQDLWFSLSIWNTSQIKYWIMECESYTAWPRIFEMFFYWIWFWESQACCKVITLTAQSVCLVRKKVVRIYLAINNAITCTTDVILNKHDLRTLLKYSIACGNTFHESYPILTPVSKLIFVKIRKFTRR